MKAALFGFLLSAGGFGAALATEAGASGGPLVLNVTPTWADEGGDRAERLKRRFEQVDQAFRAICVGCGTSASGSAHFYPYRVLNAAPPAETARD